MFKRLTVSNFRSLGENVSLDLGALTVLVGTNGSGKSNVVDALRFVADAMKLGLSGAITERHGIGAVRRWSAGHPYNLAVRVTLEIEGATASYGFELRGDTVNEYSVKSESAILNLPDGRLGFEVEGGLWRQGPHDLRPPLDKQSLALPLVGGDQRFRPLVSALQNLAIYSIFPDVLRTPQRYDPTKPMDRYGTNWTSILKDQPEDSWKPELVGVLGRLTGDVEDLRIKRAASYLVAEFRHRSGSPDSKTRSKPKWFGASQQSDGTLRVAGIVTALLQEPPLPVVGIEEPELTVHPGAVPLLVDYLKQAAKRSQVIVTTHSPELLDLIDTDDVRVVTREYGVSTVNPLDPKQLEAVRSGLLSLGEMQRGEGLKPQLALPLEAA